MVSLKHERANISSPNYKKILIFGEYAFFVMHFQNIPVYPIISKIYFCEVKTLVLHRILPN